MHQMEQYFYKGEVLKSYESAQEAKSLGQEVSLADKFIALYERFSVHNVPKAGVGATQQVERADENYDAMDDVLAIRQIKEEASFNEQVKELERVAKEGTAEQKAQSFFTQGQLFLFAHHYDESVHCFIQAVKWNPQLAVYFGICAQTMSRLDFSPFEVLAYLENAIFLDDQNARWYWNRALVLTQLYKDLQDEMFLENALIALEQAQAYCREDQRSLKSAIDNTFENMRDILLQ